MQHDENPTESNNNLWVSILEALLLSSCRKSALALIPGLAFFDFFYLCTHIFSVCVSSKVLPGWELYLCRTDVTWRDSSLLSGCDMGWHAPEQGTQSAFLQWQPCYLLGVLTRWYLLLQQFYGWMIYLLSRTCAWKIQVLIIHCRGIKKKISKARCAQLAGAAKVQGERCEGPVLRKQALCWHCPKVFCLSGNFWIRL